MTTELERTLLGSLIMSPSLLESCDLAAPDFSPGQARACFSAITTAWEEQRPREVDPVLLADQLGGDGVVEFIAGCIDGNVKPDAAGFSERARELRRRRLTARIRHALHEQDELPEYDLAEIRPLLDELDSSRTPAGETANPLITFPELRAREIHVDWLVAGLLPESSVSILYGRTTVGKSWLALMVAESVSAGLPIFGKTTRQRPVVYVDLENPLTVMKERADALKMCSSAAWLWHSTLSPGPPKLDSSKWDIYKSILPPGALVIIDTSRTAHDGKENDSDVAALVMGRCRELRDGGHTILLLHHTPKANDREIKASGAWADLADHTIQFYKVKSLGQTEEDERGEIFPGSLLCLATGKKTRYAPMPSIFLTLTPNGLILAEDPKTETLQAIADHINASLTGLNQSQLGAWAKTTLEGIGRTQLQALLDRGEREGRWIAHKGLRGAKIYGRA